MSSLRHRLVIVGLATVLLLSLSMVLLGSRSLLKFQQLLIRQVLSEQAMVISVMQDSYRAERYLAELEQRPNIWSGPDALFSVGMGTLLSGGTIQVVDMREGKTGVPDIASDILAALERSIGTGRNYLLRDDGATRSLVVNEVLTFDDTRYGVVITKNWEPVAQLSAGLRRSLLIGLVVTLFIAALGLVLVAKSVVEPLQKLSQRLARMSDRTSGVRCPPVGMEELQPLVDEFNRMAATIDEHVAELRTHASQRQRFAENLTHEIGTPLTAIKGMAMLLESGNLGPGEIRATAGSIVRSAHRLEVLQESLYELIGAQKSSSREIFEASVVQQMVVGELASLLQQKRTNLRWQILTKTLFAEPGLIGAAISNLIRNSVLASETGATVTVTIERSRGNQMIRVRDGGPGIPDQDLQRVR